MLILGAFSNVTINGGTLLLCGTATLTNTNFNNRGRPVRKMAVSLIRGTNNIRLSLDGVTAGQCYLSCQSKLDCSGPVQLIRL